MLLVLAACSSDKAATKDSDKTSSSEKTDVAAKPSGKLVIYTGRDEEMVQK